MLNLSKLLKDIRGALDAGGHDLHKVRSVGVNGPMVSRRKVLDDVAKMTLGLVVGGTVLATPDKAEAHGGWNPHYDWRAYNWHTVNKWENYNYYWERYDYRWSYWTGTHPTGFVYRPQRYYVSSCWHPRLERTFVRWDGYVSYIYATPYEWTC